MDVQRSSTLVVLEQICFTSVRSMASKRDNKGIEAFESVMLLARLYLYTWLVFTKYCMLLAVGSRHTPTSINCFSRNLVGLQS